MPFKFKKAILYLLIAAAGLTAGLFIVDRFVQQKGAAYIVTQDSCPKLQAAVVLGAYASMAGYAQCSQTG